MSRSGKFSKIFNDNFQKGYLICMMIMLIITKPFQRTAVVQLQLTGWSPRSSFCPSSLRFETRLPWLESSRPILISRSSPFIRYWPHRPSYKFTRSSHFYSPADIFFPISLPCPPSTVQSLPEHGHQSSSLYAMVSLSAKVHSEYCSSILFSRPNEG